MFGKHQVEEAVVLARGIPGGKSAPPASALVDLVRRFADIPFDVPDDPDADGFLFQYGEANWFPEPTFTLSVVRQLEVVNSANDHELYIQVTFELRYPMDDELASVGNSSSWCFPGGGDDFDDWLNSVEQDPAMRLAARKPPREFEIWEDRI